MKVGDKVEIHSILTDNVFCGVITKIALTKIIVVVNHISENKIEYEFNKNGFGVGKNNTRYITIK